MKFFIAPFTTPNQFEILPAITLRSLRCDNPHCDEIHGYDLGIHWMQWGVAAVLQFTH